MTQFAPRTAAAIMRATRVVMQTPVSLIAPPRHRPGGSASSVPSSFGFRGFEESGVGIVKVKLYGGSVRFSSLFQATMPDTVPASDDPPVVCTHVQITGTLADPTWVCIQVNRLDNACSFVALAAEPVDSGTYWYRPLHTAYISDAGKGVYVRDRRFDWCMGSPIR